MSTAHDFAATISAESPVIGVRSDLPKRPSAHTLRLVLDTICDLRAADDEYGPADGYFGQSLCEVHSQLPQISTLDISGAIEALVANGWLRTFDVAKEFVWISNDGWRHWSRWDDRLSYLLPSERPLPR